MNRTMPKTSHLSYTFGADHPGLTSDSLMYPSWDLKATALGEKMQNNGRHTIQWFWYQSKARHFLLANLVLHHLSVVTEYWCETYFDFRHGSLVGQNRDSNRSILEHHRLQLCKCDIIQNTSLIPPKLQCWTFQFYRRPFDVITYRSYKLLKINNFLALLVYYGI